jgi:cytochrome c-type biogenesis protein CcmH/NrfG
LLEEAKDLASKSGLSEASSIAERAVKANGDDLEARLLLGDIYMRGGMYEKALVQYQEALRISASDAAALRGRERALAGLRQR